LTDIEGSLVRGSHEGTPQPVALGGPDVSSHVVHAVPEHRLVAGQRLLLGDEEPTRRLLQEGQATLENGALPGRVVELVQERQEGEVAASVGDVDPVRVGQAPTELGMPGVGQLEDAARRAALSAGIVAADEPSGLKSSQGGVRAPSLNGLTWPMSAVIRRRSA
jgi:hypothetical protein